jgi:hypothetical protein
MKNWIARNCAASREYQIAPVAKPELFRTIKDKELVAQYQPVQLLDDYQSYYEELGCIDYKPETKTLEPL